MKIIILPDGELPVPAAPKRRRVSPLAKLRGCAKELDNPDTPRERRTDIINYMKSVQAPLIGKKRAEMTETEERIMLLITPVMVHKHDTDDVKIHEEFIGDC